MKYIICQEPGVFKIGQKAVPERKSGEVLLKIERVGICGTDIHAFGGNQAFFTYPRILGHELAATVVEIDPTEMKFKVGDRVTVIPYLACLNCSTCLSGKTNCCQNMQVMGVHTDGGMQEMISVPTRLVLQANNLDLDEIALIEPLAIGWHALSRANVNKGDSVVVIGCGPIGIGILKLAQKMGANVVAIEANPERLNYAKTELGISAVFPANREAPEKCRAHFGGDLAQFVFDATGNKEAMESGHHYMRHGGSYVLVGLNKGPLTFLHPEIHAKETTLLCSRNATQEDFLKVIEFLESKQFPVSKYITHQFTPGQILEEFDLLTQSSAIAIKGILEF